MAMCKLVSVCMRYAMPNPGQWFWTDGYVYEWMVYVYASGCIGGPEWNVRIFLKLYNFGSCHLRDHSFNFNGVFSFIWIEVGWNWNGARIHTFINSFVRFAEPNWSNRFFGGALKQLNRDLRFEFMIEINRWIINYRFEVVIILMIRFGRAFRGGYRTIIGVGAGRRMVELEMILFLLLMLISLSNNESLCFSHRTSSINCSSPLAIPILPPHPILASQTSSSAHKRKRKTPTIRKIALQTNIIYNFIGELNFKQPISE